MTDNRPPDIAGANFHLEAGIRLARKLDNKSAAEHFRKAIELMPEEPSGYINMGMLALVDVDFLQEGIAALKRVIEIEPNDAIPYFMLAKIFEISSNLSEAEHYLQIGTRLSPEHPHSYHLYANIRRRQGRIDEAIAKLESAPMPTNDPDLASAIHYELGKLYDRKQDSARAYAHYQKGNRLQSRTPEARQANKQTYLDRIERIQRMFTPAWLETWSPAYEPGADERPDPVFLLGFPRSGTTLLDQILSSHPQVQVIEEQPVLASTLRALGDSTTYAAALADLQASQIHDLRQKYFTYAARFLEPGNGDMFIDKYPLNIIHIGLILRLFPGARIILALRHPCDACLSCFMQNFRPNDAMANFYTLEDAARLYAAVMGLWRHYVDVMSVNYYPIKYENVVSDLEGEARRLLDFLGLEWDPRVLEYNEFARSRERINTPSYEQVTEKIYDRARYRWQRYEEQLRPVMPTLAPFIDEFGY